MNRIHHHRLLIPSPRHRVTPSPRHPVTPSPRHPVIPSSSPSPRRPLSSILYPLSSIALLVFLCCFLFFYRLADRDLWSSHEGRAAQDAQTILNDHRWGLPRLFDGKAELQKPPFYY